MSSIAEIRSLTPNQVESIYRDLNDSTAELVKLLKGVRKEKWSQRPDLDKWSAMEVMEHIVKTEYGISLILDGELQRIGRDPLQKVSYFRATFADQDRSFKAPDSALPTGDFMSVADSIAKLEKVRARLLAKAKETGLEDLCFSYKHYAFGQLTVAEWLLLCVAHADRHSRQIRTAVGI
jgi:hypothetical protein